MRLFQNSNLGYNYLRAFNSIASECDQFAPRIARFYADRYCASHILKPVYEGAEDVFFTNGNDSVLQAAWAREHGMAANLSADEILLAQIEHHRTEVFYNLDPHRFDAKFIRRLPGTVRVKIAWRAAPGKIDFTGYDRIVSNFPSIRAGYRAQGYFTDELHPAHDPVLDTYAERRDRDLDVIFCGGFTRHHLRRRAILESVAALGGDIKVGFFLDVSRFSDLANTPLGLFPPFSALRLPPVIRRVARPAVFGRAMYDVIGRAKIVLNAAIDMAGADRGNMRCFEAMGAGAALLTDVGRYPDGMAAGSNMATYETPTEAVSAIHRILTDSAWEPIGLAANRMIRSRYSKDNQWREFVAVVGKV